MEGALNWIGELVEYLGSWIPRPEIVRATERGVAFWFGKWVRVVNPGWRLNWPALMELETTPVVRQVLDLEPQTLMTKDGRPVIAGGVVVFKIQDVRAYLVENYDADDAIGEVASAALRDAIVGRSLEEIQETDGRKSIDKRLSSIAQEALTPFGVVVEYVRLTHFAEAQVINYVGASPLPTHGGQRTDPDG